MIGITGYTTTICAMAYIDNKLNPINIAVKLGLDYIDTEPYVQAVAHERIDFMMHEIFKNSILVSRHNEMRDELYDLMDNQIVECWDDPWDQLIAIMFYLKISSVLDQKIYLTFISLQCDLVEGLEFTFSGEELLGGHVSDGDDWINELAKVGFDKCWYHRNDLTTSDYIQELAGDDEHEEGELYIAKMNLKWEEIGLGWKKPADLETQVNKKKTNNIKQFVPKIVK